MKSEISKGTFHIQWHITDKCNLRCEHCYQDDFTSARDLGRPGLKTIADNIISALAAWAKTGTISLTGGEPFLKEEVFWLADYLADSEHISEINFITNGTLVDKYVSALKGVRKLGEILVSLDGSTEEVNDSIRGNNTFRRVTENIRLLSSEGFRVTVMLTLFKRNLASAAGLHDLSVSLGADAYIIERFIPLGTGGRIKNELAGPREIRELYEYIFRRCGADFDERDIARYHALRVEHKDGGADLMGALCVVGADGLAVLPDGTVLPCRRFNLSIGNLLKEPLTEIWARSEVLNKVRARKNIKGKCGKCVLSDCRGCRAVALAVTGDYLSEDPQCWL
jgi:AdoMet-dependent heme synthase